ELLGEIGIALGACHELLDQRLRRLCRHQVADLRLNVGSGQARELDPVNTRKTRQFGQPASLVRIESSSRRPVGADKDEMHIEQVADKELKDIPSGPVRPMKIFEAGLDGSVCPEVPD